MYERAYTWTIFGVSNKQLASQKQQNEHVLHVITRFGYAISKLKDNALLSIISSSSRLSMMCRGLYIT